MTPHGTRKAHLQWKRRRGVRLENLIQTLKETDHSGPASHTSHKHDHCGFQPGDEVRVKYLPGGIRVPARDRDGVVVYAGPERVPRVSDMLLGCQFWLDDTAQQQFGDALNHRHQPTRVNMARGKVFGVTHEYGPLVVRVIRVHKTTGRPLKPRFIHLYPNELKHRWSTQYGEPVPWRHFLEPLPQHPNHKINERFVLWAEDESGLPREYQIPGHRPYKVLARRLGVVVRYTGGWHHTGPRPAGATVPWTTRLEAIRDLIRRKTPWKTT